MDNGKVAIVGGIPDPIGGVTTFIRRVIRRERCITHLFDLYPSASKKVPPEFSGRYICERNKLFTLVRLWLLLFRGDVDYVHFNFSTPKALPLLLLLPKKNVKWLLMLHHGNLGEKVHRFSQVVLSKKVDTVLCLNERQARWYRLSVSDEKIRPASSYVPPPPPTPTPEFCQFLAPLKSRYKRIFVCSGYPTAIYNKMLSIELMRYFPECLLFCCVYGLGDLLGQLREAASAASNVLLVEGLEEENFNFLLASSDIYLRLNTEDSFGIAVADALILGSKSLATNVCPRFPGAHLVSADIEVGELRAVIGKILETEPERSIDNPVIGFTYTAYVGSGL